MRRRIRRRTRTSTACRCHTDHNYFNGSSATSPAANLRYSIDDNNPSLANESTNTDFIASGAYGVCVSCHDTVLNVDNVNQKARPYSQTQIVAGATYANSSHDYYATSAFGASTFRADCAKCHTDSTGLDSPNRQTSATKFATHQSPERNILAALGGTQTDPYEEQFCYRCHSGAGPNDYYNVSPMSAMARATSTSFTAGTSKHPLTPNAAGSVVACVNCHNPHVASNTATSQDPDNTYNNLANGTTFCLRCHDGGAPNARSVSGSLVSTRVVIGASAATSMNVSAYAARGHWSAFGSIGAGEVKGCEKCHEQHGSSLRKLIATSVNGTRVVDNDNSVCYACHEAKSTSFPASTSAGGSLDASFYPQNGSWPNRSTFTASQHGTSVPNVVWPGTTYKSGDCKNCHDVHGTANTYDELVATFTSGRLHACASPATTERLRPTTSRASTRSPPAARARTLVAVTARSPRPARCCDGNAAIPCYACHNPHGSAETTFGLMVVARGQQHHRRRSVTVQASSTWAPQPACASSASPATRRPMPAPPAGTGRRTRRSRPATSSSASTATTSRLPEPPPVRTCACR